MLERADPHDLVRMILSGLRKQHDAGRAFDRSNPEGEHDAQPETFPTAKGESVGSEAASDASAAAVVSIAQSAADPGSAGHIASVSAIPSRSGTASTNVVDSPDLTACLSPPEREADAFAGERTPASTPRSSPATQTPIRTSGGDRAHDERSKEPTHRRGPRRLLRKKVPRRPAKG